MSLAIGTKIRFVKDLTAPANEDHPSLIYASKGETGEVTGHGTREGYWAKTDHWPHAFGASEDEFETINQTIT